MIKYCLGLLLLITLFSCKEEDACVDFISDEDIVVDICHRCDEEGLYLVLEFSQRQNPNQNQNLNLQYSAEYEGTVYELSDAVPYTILLPESAVGNCTIVAKNYGCSIEKIIELEPNRSADDQDPCKDFITAEEISYAEYSACDERIGRNYYIDFKPIQNTDQDDYDLHYSVQYDGISYAESDSLPNVVLLPPSASGNCKIFATTNCCTLETKILLNPSGFINGSAIGNKVWLDNLINFGFYDVYDTGDDTIEGVEVDLLNAFDSTIIQTTVTDVSGEYLFIDLDKGKYIIRFHNPKPYSGYNGLRFVIPNSGFDDSIDSDCDQMGYTDVIELGHCELNLTIDAGLRRY